MPLIEELTDRSVEDYDPAYSPVDMNNVVYRIGSYNPGRTGYDFESLMEAFGQEPELEEVTALVLGSWGIGVPTSEEVNPALCLWQLREAMPRLSCLYIGDIDGDEAELSWIKQTQWGVVLNAFDELDEVTIKGGDGLRLSKLSLPCLESLTLIATELSNDLLRDVATAKLPGLQHLELWLGDAQGQDPSAPIHALDTLRPFFFHTSSNTLLFPRLHTLGLRNCGWIDELLVETVGAPLWSSLRSLDLSMGTLSDEGVEALLRNDLTGLKQLDVSNSYVQDAQLLEQLSSRGISCVAEDMRQIDPDGSRYVDVWE